MWSAVFYALALVANYPHYAATLHRACAARDDRQPTAPCSRNRPPPWRSRESRPTCGSHSAVDLHAVNVSWSPWHYTGQNFGLAIMQLRRAGVVLTGTERWQLRTAFVVSYGLLLVTLNSGPKTDPMVLALGLPTSLAAVVAIAGGALFLVLGALAFASLERRVGARLILPAAVPFVTQRCCSPKCSTLIATVAGLPRRRRCATAPARWHSCTRPSTSGSRSITPDATPKSRAGSSWRPWRYAAGLAVGAALFVPGPWISGYTVRADFSTSVLVFAQRRHLRLPHRRCRLAPP